VAEPLREDDGGPGFEAIATDRDRLDEYVTERRSHEGGAIVVCLGVPETAVDDREVSHHKLLADTADGGERADTVFVSVSGPDDDVSAPPGRRAVMLSTHCELDPWLDLDRETYERRKEAAGERLVEATCRVYPSLGTDPEVYHVATPATFESFTNRPRGAVGGYRQTPRTANQFAVPQDIGVDGFYLAGDTTWPGLGMMACLKGSKVAADHVRTGL